MYNDDTFSFERPYNISQRWENVCVWLRFGPAERQSDMSDTWRKSLVPIYW